MLQQTLPPISQGEIDFYEREELLRWANDENATSPDSPMIDQATGAEIEPALQFHEFLFMLGLIARRCITSSTNIVDQLSEFYIKELDFKPRTRDEREDLYYDDVLESV